MTSSLLSLKAQPLTYNFSSELDCVELIILFLKLDNY